MMILIDKRGVVISVTADADPDVAARVMHWIAAEAGVPVLADVLATRVKVSPEAIVASLDAIDVTAAEIKAAIDKRSPA